MIEDQEIRECYQRMGAELAEQGILGDKRWYSNSQYGYSLGGPFATQREAEDSAMAYYRDRMHLIRQ